jgi:hypothetical protein
MDGRTKQTEINPHFVPWRTAKRLIGDYGLLADGEANWGGNLRFPDCGLRERYRITTTSNLWDPWAPGKNARPARIILAAPFLNLEDEDTPASLGRERSSVKT